MVMEDQKLVERHAAAAGLDGVTAEWPRLTGPSALNDGLLAGELEPADGRRLEGRGLTIGYFAQHQLEQLRPAESPVQHLVRMEPYTRFVSAYSIKTESTLHEKAHTHSVTLVPCNS